MKSLLRLAMTNVHFRTNGMWCVQSDGLAMVASLAVILANSRMKTFAATLHKPELSKNICKSDQNDNCKDWNRRLTFRAKGVE